MKDTRTDEEKELSEYFSHWNYTGNWLQKRLRIGPKEALFTRYTAKELKAMKESGEEIYIEPTTQVAITGGAKKAVTLHQWFLDWADDLEDADWKLANHGWAYRCIEIKRLAISAIPWGIFKGDKEIEPNDYWRLLNEVNPENNWPDLISSLMADMDIFGRGFWEKVRADKKVKHLRRLNPRTMKVKASRKGIEEFIQQTQGKPITFPREDIVYFHLYDPEDDVGGISPLQACKTACEIEIEADKHLKEFFENKAMPDYIMSLDTTNVRELARVSDQWEKDFRGEGKQHKVGWVGGGGTPHEVGYAPKDLALKELREEARRKICADFGVPPALVGAWEAANYATIREQRQFLYTGTLNPLARYFQSVINAELTPDFGTELEFRFKFDDMPELQEDLNSKSKRIIWNVEAGVLTREAAAIRQGFDVSEVPPEAPAPKPSDNSNLASVGSRAGDELGTPGGRPSSELRETRRTFAVKIDSAMRKWRRKCMRRLKNEQSALCDFTSAYIDDEISEAIKTELGTAKTKDDVHKIFENATAYLRDYEFKDEILTEEIIPVIRQPQKAEHHHQTNIIFGTEEIAKELGDIVATRIEPRLESIEGTQIETQKAYIEIAADLKRTAEEYEFEMSELAKYLEEEAKKSVEHEGALLMIAEALRKMNKQNIIVNVEPTPIENKVDVEVELPGRITGKKRVKRERGLITEIDEEMTIE